MKWYGIRYLHVADVMVRFRVGSGVVRGKLKIGSKGGYQYWIEDGRRLRRLPDYTKPWCWQPERLDEWPDHLPKIAINESLGDNDTVQDELEEEADGINAILNPDFRLGKPSERPQTRAEAETRFLRALLTDRFMERLEPAIQRARSTAADWPREFVVGAKVVEAQLKASRTGKIGNLREEDYDDFFIDESELEARPPPWEPTRRDIGDWEHNVLRWGRGINRVDMKIIRLRCARWSYRGISQRTPLSYEAIRQRYSRAIDRVWRQARGA